MSRLFAARIAGVPWSILALVALAVAVAYVVIDTSGDATGWRWFVLRWFHSLCWLLLAVAAVGKARIGPLPEAAATPLAVAGGLVYVAFIATTFLSGD